MAASLELLALPEILRSCGLTVIEVPGWQTRANDDGPFAPIAIIDHHDGMGLDNTNVPTNMARPGQNGAQIWIRRNADVHMIAAGRMPHAGKHARWGDLPENTGNALSVGLETDYAGYGPWPPDLLFAWRIVRRELAKSLDMKPGDVSRRMAGHKEIAPNRKTDPANIDMPTVRRQLVADLNPEQDIDMDEATLQRIVSLTAEAVLNTPLRTGPGDVRSALVGIEKTVQAIDRNTTAIDKTTTAIDLHVAAIDRKLT